MNKKKMLKSVIKAMIFAVIAVGFIFNTNCSVMAEDEGEQIPVRLVSLAFPKERVDLFEGQKIKLSVEKSPENANEEIVYTVSDPDMVEVKDGMLVAGKINDDEMKESGQTYKECELTASNQDGSIKTTCIVRVKVGVEKITITPTRNAISRYSVVLRTNKKSNFTTLKVKVYPSNAYDKKYTVAFKKKKFKMTKVADGAYRIKAYPYKKKYISYFTVTSYGAKSKVVQKKRIYGVKVANKIRVERVKTPKAAIRVHNINAGRKVKMKVVPITKGVTTNAVIWKSSNPKVATVNKNGVVTALKKGKVKIVGYAMYNTKAKAGFVFKVHKPVVLEWPIHKKFDDQYNIESFFGGARGHNGIDIIVGHKKVYAAAEGVIKKVGYEGGWGRCIVIKHPGGGQTLYSHLSSYSKYAKKGRKVTTSTPLGVSGSSGRATCAHLHFEIHKRNGKEFSAIPHSSTGYNPPFKKQGKKYVYDPDFIWP